RGAGGDRGRADFEGENPAGEAAHPTGCGPVGRGVGGGADATGGDGGRAELGGGAHDNGRPPRCGWQGGDRSGFARGRRPDGRSDEGDVVQQAQGGGGRRTDARGRGDGGHAPDRPHGGGAG